MLEKFYFESFLIAFSALIGAVFSFAFNWTIEKSGLDFKRKFIFLISLLFMTLLFVMIVLYAVIYLIGVFGA